MRVAKKSEASRACSDGNKCVLLIGFFMSIISLSLSCSMSLYHTYTHFLSLSLSPVAIYECEKTFERIFLGALFGPHAPHFIAGWRSDFQDQVSPMIDPPLHFPLWVWK